MKNSEFIAEGIFILSIDPETGFCEVLDHWDRLIIAVEDSLEEAISFLGIPIVAVAPI